MRGRVLLIAPPWQSPFLPSIQIGALKPYLEGKVPSVTVDVWSAFVEPAEYLPIRFVELCGKQIHLGELLFIALLFPENRMAVLDELAIYSEELDYFGVKDLEQDILDPLEQHTKRAIDLLNLDSVFLIGLSVTYAQIFSSAYYAKLLRNRRPEAKIVVGGNLCQTSIGKMFLRCFRWIDFIVHGEGELPLTKLVKYLLDHKEPFNVLGLYNQNNIHQLDKPEKNQLDDLDQLTMPYYDEYFALVESNRHFQGYVHEIRLPIEGSRGCWWDRTHKTPDAICQFCDNNNVWSGYRIISSRKVIAHIDKLTNRHECLNVLFTDNISRVRGFKTLFSGLASLPKTLRIFSEAYASLGIEDFVLLKSAGVREIQFGIEALSTPILKVMKKGTTFIKNAFVMKMCEEFDFKNYSNIITHYPQISKDHIYESYENAIRLCAYYSLHPVKFKVNQNSPIAMWPERYGITNVDLDPMFKRVLPLDVQLDLFIAPNIFESQDIEKMRKYWDQLFKTVLWWKTNRTEKQKFYEVSRLLTHTDGGKFLEICDYRYESPKVHLLKDWEQDLYKFLYYPRKFQHCIDEFNFISPSQLEAKLNSWYRKFLVIKDNDWWLALSVFESCPEGNTLMNLLHSAPSEFKCLERSTSL